MKVKENVDTESASRSLKQQIKGFVGVTDGEWFGKKGTRVKELASWVRRVFRSKQLSL